MAPLAIKRKNTDRSVGADGSGMSRCVSCVRVLPLDHVGAFEDEKAQRKKVGVIIRWVYLFSVAWKVANLRVYKQ
jgi:hypothetical protein